MKRSQINRGTSQLKRTPFVKSKRTKCRDIRLAGWGVAIKERDHWRCVVCGGRDRLQSHHIAPRSRRPDLAFDLTNGITLCTPHHEWVHANPIEATALGLLSDVPYERRKVA